ncbi:hypothetical protein KBK19_17705 [Microvirga sp. STR05]|uniref:Uncharacterized protein n=1 Tax=Hymenobacter duratus TaxID=2771356 RepID=A0ABR8JJ51_9BACT|nr:hypothetical protein [Hymenobacter duratus]MBD2716884.1 hypothetical protein [Hymenobacter duratus]MBR7951800.1 hypothetical protein [Microvirga sp. STR05]
MNKQDFSILESGQRVGLAVEAYRAEIDDFGPLQEANASREALVKAIEEKAGTQQTMTTDATTAKDAAREAMARATEVLSARAVAYALAAGRLDLKQAFTLTYSDVRNGEAAEDVDHVRELVRRVSELPADVRKNYRLTPAVMQAPADAADAFEAASDVQTEAKAAPRLATLALPELLRPG